MNILEKSSKCENINIKRKTIQLYRYTNSWGETNITGFQLLNNL